MPVHSGARSARSAARSVPCLAALVALLAVLAAGGGCASTASGRAPYATVIVINDATATVNVYALRQGSRMRLGTVTSLGRAEFAVRRTMLDGLNELQLLIDPIGSRGAYPSHSISVEEGDVVELRVSAFVR